MRLIDAYNAEKILREYADDVGCNRGEYELANGILKAVCKLENVPTVEAKEVVHAEWRHLGGDEWCCTECGHVINTEGSWEKPTEKFCEECGADMRKKV